MILLKSAEEIEKIRAAGRVSYRAIQAMKACIDAGRSTTSELEKAAIKVIADHGADSPCLGYAPHGHPPYPAWTCISVNEEVVHGIPGGRVLKEGDIVTCDVSVRLNGYYADSARTFPVGNISLHAARLLKVTEEALYRGVALAKHGGRLGDIGNVIERHAKQNGFSVVRDMVGHGVGRSLHEEPQIPNYGKPGTGIVLREGMTLAIEPMVNAGRHQIEALEDELTIVTSDRKLSAHFEHTVAVTRDGPLILTQGE